MTAPTHETQQDVAEDLFWSEEADAYVTYEEFMKLKYGIIQDETVEDEHD